MEHFSVIDMNRQIVFAARPAAAPFTGCAEIRSRRGESVMLGPEDLQRLADWIERFQHETVVTQKDGTT